MAKNQLFLSKKRQNPHFQFLKNYQGPGKLSDFKVLGLFGKGIAFPFRISILFFTSDEFLGPKTDRNHSFWPKTDKIRFSGLGVGDWGTGGTGGLQGLYGAWRARGK
jgi:hypothetical protein